MHLLPFLFAGVFTVSDDLLEKAAVAEFTIMKDDQLTPVQASPIVSKIEEKVKSVLEGEKNDQAPQANAVSVIYVIYYVPCYYMV